MGLKAESARPTGAHSRL